MNLRLRLAIEWIVIGLIATALVLTLLYRNSASAFDNLFFDELQSASQPKADDNILLVTIDEASLAKLGRWPWPREYHAKILEKLQASSPRSILLDVILSEESDASSDARLANAMRGISPVFIPLHFSSPGSEGRNYDAVFPIEQFRSSARAIGHVNVDFDDDGVVRRTSLCFKPDEKGSIWPHIVEQLYRTTDRKTPSKAYSSTPCNEPLMLRFSPRSSFAEISYSELLEGNVPTSFIKGRDVFIGATAAGMGDNFPTPNADGGLLPGIEIMANVLASLRTGNFIKPLSFAMSAVLTLVPMWLLLIGFLRWRPRAVLIASLTLVAVILAGSALLLGANIWFAPGAALLGILFVYPLWGWRRLQAMSDFFGHELGALKQENEIANMPTAKLQGTDLVGRQSAALAEAIDHIRDLRRFVSDALDDLPDPMFVTDLAGKVTLTNDEFDVRFGKETMGKSLDQFLDSFVASSYRPAVDRYLALRKDGDSDAEASSDSFVRFETLGAQTYVMRQAPINSDQDELRGQIHYLADISALANAQEEREQVLQLLSHDMRAPQSAIIAALSGKLDEGARDRIERNARRTMQLAQDFVDMARMEDSEFVGEDVLLADLIRDVADGLWPLAKEKGVQINIIDNCDAGFVLAEPDSLSRAFVNLFDNALKYSPEKSEILVRIDREEIAVPILKVTICDAGAGISEEILPRLFSRFATTGEMLGRSKGMGLGLSFVAAVAKRHGGTVMGQNSKSGGACFTLSFPEAVEPAA